MAIIAQAITPLALVAHVFARLGFEPYQLVVLAIITAAGLGLEQRRSDYWRT